MSRRIGALLAALAVTGAALVTNQALASAPTDEPPPPPPCTSHTPTDGGWTCYAPQQQP